MRGARKLRVGPQPVQLARRGDKIAQPDLYGIDSVANDGDRETRTCAEPLGERKATVGPGGQEPQRERLGICRFDRSEMVVKLGKRLRIRHTVSYRHCASDDMR